MRLEEEIKQIKFKSEHLKALINIIYTASWVNSYHAHFFKPYDLTQQQFNILRILRGQFPKPATVNLLIDRMIDKMSNASRLVEKLRKKGLLVRIECSKDRRQVDVLITPKGLDILSKIDKQEKKMENKFETITKKEAKELSRILDKLRA